MSNHYTSYEVSKAMAEANIVIGDPFYWIDKSGYFVNAFNPIIDGMYPAYTAGELLRELQKVGTDTIKISFESEAGFCVDYYNEDTERSWAVNYQTIEDTLGRALITLNRYECNDRIKKGEDDE